MITQEHCPNCNALNPIEKYQPFKLEEKTVMASPDVKCKCGVIIRAIVPMFCVSKSGYQFKILPHQKLLD